MKICPACSKKIEENIDFCPDDGEVLVYDLSALVGQTLDGQYQIEALLGGGGMGAVYRARHIMLGDRVAIKVIRPDIGRSPEFLRRFRREGQAARRFRHPNSITVHDLRTTNDGLTYMVLEYVEGTSLRDELDRRGRFSAREAFEILEPAANALSEAHSVGVIHRDLKPDNIMIGSSANGQTIIKVLDLGLAKIRQMPDISGTAVTALTVGGQLLGTPFYMPPEQWGASSGDDDIDGRADIYSLGVVFYEMISGGKPFKGKSIQELAREHAITDPTPLHELRKDVPEDFSNAVAHAMAKDRDERYSTVAEFLSDLRASVEKMPKSDKAGFLETAETIHFSSPNIPADTMPKKAVDTVPDKLAKTVPDTPEIKIDDKFEDRVEDKKFEDKKFEDRKEIAPVPPAPRTSPVGAIAAAALVVLSIAAWFVWKALNPPVEPGHNNNGTEASSTESIEVMRYWLETESPVQGGPTSRAVGPIALESGQEFKFHFSAREFGYIYIVGKGRGNAPTAFLTAKPSPMAGMKTNSIKVGEDFHFPGGNIWIEFDRNAGTEKYTIIYSSAPLTSPSFLNKETEYELTPDDHKAWEDFRAKALIASTSVTSGEEPAAAVLLPKSKADGQPFIFEVSIDHK